MARFVACHEVMTPTCVTFTVGKIQEGDGLVTEKEEIEPKKSCAWVSDRYVGGRSSLRFNSELGGWLIPKTPKIPENRAKTVLAYLIG